MRKWLTIIIGMLPLIVTLWVLPAMADIVPVHYGVDGSADRFDSKYTLLVMPIITLVLTIFFVVWPRFADVSRADQQANLVVLERIMVPMVIFLAALNGIIVWMAYTEVTQMYDTSLPVPRLIAGLMSLLFVVIGNVLPKTKRNHWIGVRLPWTLASDEVWYKTHRLAGYLYTGSGIVGLLTAMLVAEPVWTIVPVIGGVLGSTLIAGVYSYRLSRR